MKNSPEQTFQHVGDNCMVQKMKEIGHALAIKPEKAVLFQNRFKESWDHISEYDSSSNKKEMQKKILDINYEIGNAGLVGIKGIP